MPVTRCQVDKKQGYKWGNGACYPYKANSKESRKKAYDKALLQGRAIHRALDMKGGMMKTQTIHKVFGAAGPAVFTPSGNGGTNQREIAIRLAKELSIDSPRINITKTEIFDMENGIANVGMWYEMPFMWGSECGQGRYEAVVPPSDYVACVIPESYSGVPTGKEGLFRGTVRLHVDTNKSGAFRACTFEDDMGTEKYLVAASGVVPQRADEGLRELTEQSALSALQEYITSLGWPAAWIVHVEDAVMDRFYAAFARQQRWDDAYLSAKTAVGEYHRQYLDYEAMTWDRLARGLEPPAWLMPESVAAEAEQIMNEKVGGGMMMKPLSLRGVLMASASLGDLLAVLKQVQGPTDHVKKAVKQLEGMVAKYDEGAGAKDVKAEAIKAIQTLLKKVPKPTEDHPRTRVMRALKLLEKMLGKNVSAGILSASIVEVAKLLKAIADQSDEVKKAVKMAADLAEAYEKGAPQGYGNIVSVQGMTKLLKALEAIEDKPTGVTKAIKSLKGLMGTEEKSTLPGYGVSKLETATAPGVYRARLISEGPALDGTNWDAEQLKSAVERHLFDGVPLNAISYSGSYGPDIEYHLPVDSALVGQVVGNQVGFIQPGATWEFDDGLKKFAAFGNVCITDPSRRNLVDAMLDQGLDAPGMSIYADGSKDDNEMVTGITAVHSMDLVTFPAADGYILSQALTASIKEWGQMKTRLMAAGNPAGYTTGSGGGKDWGVIWETYLDSRLRPLAARAVADAITQLNDLDIPLSADAWQSTDIKDSDAEAEDILERVQDDLMKLFASPNIDTGQLPVWGAALIRKYGNEYAASLIDTATNLWKGITSKKVGGGIMGRMQAADTEGLPPADPAPAEAAPEAPAPAPAAQPVDVGASWTQAYTIWRTIDWMAQLNAVKAQGNVSDAIMKLMDKMKMSIDEFSQLALAGAPKEEYDKLVARYAPAAPAPEAAPAVETPPAQAAPAAPAAPAATVQSAIMDQRIAAVAEIARKLDQRVAQADVDELIERKVRASNLPRSVAQPLQASMTGQPLSAGEVDGFIRFEQDVCDSLAGNLAETAGVTIDGELHSDSNNDTLDGALDALFKSQEAA